jgi:hypothetical protein
MMSTTSKREYLASIQIRYKTSPKAIKTTILNEFCRICEYDRKYALRLLNPKANHFIHYRKSKSGRPATYHHPEILSFLKRLWIASNLACGKRLKAMLPLWLPFDDTGISQNNQKLLLTISAATIDRLLASLRSRYAKKGLATTKPGSLLKKHIPIKTNQWDEHIPGFIEADTVAHCGTSMAGMFVFTLNTVDIATGWTEQRALWGKGEHGVLSALQDIEAALPFSLKGFDCDNGSEFMNWTILKHFQERKRPVHYTRSREYQKNDNAHIEGKNWTHIRQYLGYDRFEDQRMVYLLNDLYSSQWRLLFNFFLPSVKLLAKERIKSKTIKTFDSPKTPFQRLLESKEVSQNTKDDLQCLFKNLNPFTLQKFMSKKIRTILHLATPWNKHIKLSA